MGICIFCSRQGLEQSNATVRWTVAGDGSMEPNLNLLPLGADANESLTVYVFILNEYYITKYAIL